MWSRPTRACGLKLSAFYVFSISINVTPHAGVWIETIDIRLIKGRIYVTPHAGVWIETLLFADCLLQPLGHAPRGRVD